jgi:hypothetical protein
MENKKKIGLVSIYPSRPHVEHLAFITNKLVNLGYDLYHLSYKGTFELDYAKFHKNTFGKILETFKARYGGLYGYHRIRTTFLEDITKETYDHERSKDLCFSSASTLLRVEQISDTQDKQFKDLVTQLSKGVSLTVPAVRKWISDNQIEKVICFNGRIDLTAAVMQACRDEKIKFISLERSWFGEGIQLLEGDNCLGLDSVNRMMQDWINKPLNERQLKKVSNLMLDRIEKKLNSEFRIYNKEEKSRPWPAKGARKFLFLPSTNCETWDHKDHLSRWTNSLEACDYMASKLNIQPSEIV